MTSLHGHCEGFGWAVRELAQPSQATSPKQKSSRKAGKGGGAKYSCKGPTQSQTAKVNGGLGGSVSRSLILVSIGTRQNAVKSYRCMGGRGILRVYQFSCLQDNSEA